MAEQEYEIRNKHMLIVAGVLGLIAVLLVLWNESRIRRENDEDLIKVLVAAQDIKENQKLASEDIKTSSLPKRLVPQDVLDDVTRESDEKWVLSLQTNQEIAKDRIIRTQYLQTATGQAVDPRLPRPGYRVVPMKIGDRDVCPAGLTPGMYVDVMAHVIVDGRPDMMPVIQRVQVKHVNGQGTASGKNLDAVGLEVREQDARLLRAFLGGARTQVELWIRSPNDPVDEKLKGGFNPALETTGQVRPQPR